MTWICPSCGKCSVNAVLETAWIYFPLEENGQYGAGKVYLPLHSQAILECASCGFQLGDRADAEAFLDGQVIERDPGR
jgi:predicted RNA-binding Zn-ribbon protein involved in translation (DUF1610 family)